MPERILRPQSALATAAKVVDAIRFPFVLAKEQLTLAVTVSVGVALTVNESQMTAAILLERADRALYKAKSAGRDGYLDWTGNHAAGARTVPP